MHTQHSKYIVNVHNTVIIIYIFSKYEKRQILIYYLIFCNISKQYIILYIFQYFKQFNILVKNYGNIYSFHK